MPIDVGVAHALEFEKRLAKTETVVAVLDERSVSQSSSLKRIEDGQTRILGAAVIAALSAIGSIVAFVLTHHWT